MLPINVHKRTKKPAFMKVFERSDEKESNPLLHDSTLAGSGDELDATPLFNNTLKSLAAEETKEVDDKQESDHFVTASYDYDDDADDSESPSGRVDGRGDGGVISPSQSEEAPLETTNQRSVSDTLVFVQNKSSDNGRGGHHYHRPEAERSAAVIANEASSEHARAENLAAHAGSSEKSDGIVVDNSVEVPDNLARHASAAAAVAKQRDRRSKRLLSGAKGLLRGGKGATSPKTTKIELEAAVRKVSAGESAKSFAQFSLEEIVPGGDGAPSSGVDLLTNRDELGNNDSDDDETRYNEDIQQPYSLNHAQSQDESSSDEDIHAGSGKHTGAVSPHRSRDRSRKRSVEESDTRTRQRNHSARPGRRSSVKGATSRPKHEREQKPRSDEVAPRDPTENQRKHSAHPRPRDAHAERHDNRLDGKSELSTSHHRTSRDRRRSEIRPRKEHGEVVASADADTTQRRHIVSADNRGKKQGASEHIMTDNPMTLRASHPSRKDRTSKTTYSPDKRGALAKSFSDRVLSKHSGVEAISSAAVERKLLKKDSSTTDDLHIRRVTSLELSTVKNKNIARDTSETTGPESKQATHERLRDKSDLPGRHKAQMEQAIPTKSPRKIVADKDRSRVVGSNHNHRPTHRPPERTGEKKSSGDMAVEVKLEVSDTEGRLTKCNYDNGSDGYPSDDVEADMTAREKSASADLAVDDANDKPILTSEMERNVSSGELLADNTIRGRETVATAQKSPYMRRRTIPSSNLSDPESPAGPASPPQRAARTRGLSATRRAPRGPVPRSPQQQPEVVFTWRRNAPPRATIAATRRTARLLRQGSLRATGEDTSQLSEALAKAFAVNPGSVSPKPEEPRTIPASVLLSDELREEYRMLSLELSASKTRTRDANAAVVRLRQEIADLQRRLDQVEQRKR